MNRNLFLAISIPDDIEGDDPDDVADQIVALLNDARRTQAWATAIVTGGDLNAASVERIVVHAIPTPQWLTRETLDALRSAAQRTNPPGQP